MAAAALASAYIILAKRREAANVLRSLGKPQ
jgi:hypothetical protein